MREKILIVLLILTACVVELYPAANAQDAADKARQLIAAARQALGGDNLKSLSAEGSYRRTLGQMDMSGDLTLELIAPDKILKLETMRPFGDLEINFMQVWNGEVVWEDQQQSGGGGNVMIRRGAPTGDPKKAKEMAEQSIRADFARLTLGMLAATPPGFPVEYTYAGEADSPEGKADVLDVKGPNRFAARLFLDQKRHHPLMLTYKGVKPRVVTHSANGGPPSDAELEQRLKEAQAEAAKAPEVEFQVRFGEYKTISGVTLPHKISKGIGSETNEEIEFTKFKVNPPIKAERFVKK
jgi:hypothetical protein